MTKSSFCPACGCEHQDPNARPKKCGSCNHEVFTNPTPVVIVLLKTSQGSLVVRRAIPPQIGFWALPGGYVDDGETAEEAGRRELLEETGIAYSGDFELLAVKSSSTKKQIMIFLKATLPDLDVSQFKPNSEVSEIQLVKEEIELAFQSHSEIIKQFG